MTEQEAKELGVRLARVWEVFTPFEIESAMGLTSFIAPLSPDVELRVYVLGGFLECFLHDVAFNSPILCWDESETSRTMIVNDWGGIPAELLPLESLQREWMDIFRRGCWLSGCAIEATAHEKLEWLQDLTQEEVDTWNLKL